MSIRARGRGRGASLPPRPVIIDTDAAGDSDDFTSLRMAAVQHHRGEIALKVVAVNSGSDRAVANAGVMLANDGLPDVPLGAYKGAAINGTHSSLLAATARLRGEYARPYASAAAAPEAVTVLRTALAGCPDGSVNYVSIGFLTNLAALFVSPADAISPLTGLALARRKIRRLTLMAGDRPAGDEFNLKGHPAASAAVFAAWTDRIDLVGFSVGSAVLAGRGAYACEPTDPLRRLLRQPWLDGAKRLPAERASWDPLATLAGMTDDPAAIGFGSIRGTMTVSAANGTNTWEDSPAGRHYWLTAPANARELINGMLSLEHAADPAPNRTPTAHLASRRRRARWTPWRIKDRLIVWAVGEDLDHLAVGAAIGGTDTWPNRAEPGGAFTQAAAGRRPTVQRNATTGLWVVRGDGADDYLDLALADVRIPQPVLLVAFTATRAPAAGLWQQVALVPHDPAAHVAPHLRYGGFVDQGGGWNGSHNGRNQLGPVRAWPNRTYLGEVHGGAGRQYVDGRFDGDIGSPQDVTYPNASPLRLFANGAGGECLQGDIHEVVLTSPLSSADLAELRAYLQRANGIPSS